MININEKEAETILIDTIMTPLPLVVANSSESIFKISNLMKERKVGSIIIINQDDQNYPIGIITERDIVRRVISDNKYPKHTKATEIMSKPLITIEANTYVYDVSVKMVKNKIRRLPVVKGKTLSGIITITDIIKYFHEKNKDNNYLSKAMTLDMVGTGKSNIINLIIIISSKLIILICGYPVVGKTTVAHELAPLINAVVLSTDKIRKELLDKTNYGEEEKKDL